MLLLLPLLLLLLLLLLGALHSLPGPLNFLVRDFQPSGNLFYGWAAKLRARLAVCLDTHQNGHHMM